MTINEIMEKIREGLTGEYSVDMVYLESQTSTVLQKTPKRSKAPLLTWHMRSCPTTSGKFSTR